MKLIALKNNKAPKAFRDESLWTVKAVQNKQGLVVGVIVRSKSNEEQNPEEEIWAGFKFAAPWDMEFNTNTPEMTWFVAYVGEDSWREVYNDFKKENAA